MDLSPNQMLRLAPNKVDYLIPGGEMINEFLGEGPGARVCSQMWIASLVTSALQPGTATGLSRVAGTDVLLRDCLAENPAAWLGEAHAAHWGVSLGFLLKLLHSRDRLLLQTHPDGARARKYFGLPSGKDEAWYVLDTRPGACIWLGFRPGVTPAYFRGLIERQDTAALLDCLHQIPIRPGEVYFIPAGTAHAMGSDSLVAELQEPVDITLRAEYIRPDRPPASIWMRWSCAGRPMGAPSVSTVGSRCSWCWRERRSSSGRAVPCGPAGARSSLSPTAWPPTSVRRRGRAACWSAGFRAREAAAKQRGGAPAGAPPLCFAHFPQENRPFFS